MKELYYNKFNSPSPKY